MTIPIVGLTVLVSIYAFYDKNVLGKLIFNPWQISERKQWYRFITSGFIHADYLHLGVNMLVLFSFGQAVENDYAMVFGVKGSYYYILLYLAGLVFSITPSYLKHKQDFQYNALGASGAVSAVLFVSILFNPLAPIYLYGIIKIPGILVGIGYLFYEYQAGKKGGSNINHDAHLWGAVFGIAYTILIYPDVIMIFAGQFYNY
ncbi:MAG: rhomboid family intramembrane serine protease [Bacteroidia bacterium]|nr:rhomboid family intramembrane serine protease [Bacteroidia bacterium]MCZ2276914.1 rhomboid family intramembrane serine protease [Bacteroidia bacterium]